MTYRIVPVPPFDYVVFGATGDLARRKLMPAIYNRMRGGQVADGSRIVGVSRREMSDDEYRADDPRGARAVPAGGGLRQRGHRSLPWDAHLRRLRRRQQHRLGPAERAAQGRRREGARLLPRSQPRALRRASAPASAVTISSRRSPASSSKSRSARISHPRARSTRPWARSSPRSRSSASTIISARRPCRT